MPFGKKFAAALQLVRPSAPQKTESPVANTSHEHMKAEFARRILPSFVDDIGSDMAIDRGMYITQMFNLAGLALIAAPVLAVPSMLVYMRGIFKFLKVVAPNLKAAQREITADLKGEERQRRSHLEAWMDAHADYLPLYLDSLDRYEEEIAQVHKLVEKVNKGKSLDVLKPEDKALLRKHNYPRRLKLPLPMPFKIPPCRGNVGNWHHTTLTRALRKEIKAQGGGDISVAVQLFKRNPKAAEPG